MNEPNQGAAPFESVEQPTPYKNRSGGLILFGILTILMGSLVGLFVPLMFFGQVMAARTGAPATPMSAILPAVSIYGVLAVALVWLGIGSIKARRWARALMLIFSWSWLVMGLVMLVFMVFFLPKIFANLPANGTTNQPAMPPGMVTVMMVVMFLFVSVFFVILPAVWTFFYGSRHVKATCEARDPVTRWTDACPLPVLGLCMWVLFGVPMLLIMPLTGHVVMPLFGDFVTGLPASLICVAFAAIWSYAAWLLYKLDRRGFWLILITLFLFTVSSVLTYARHDMMEVYKLMDYPEAQIEQMQKFSLVTGHRMAWLMPVFMLPFLGYLFAIKKYLRR